VLLSTGKVLATLDQGEWESLKQAGLRWLATDVLPPSLAEAWTMPDISADTLAVLQYTSGSTGQPKGVQLHHRHLLLNSQMLARAMGCGRDSVGVIWIPPYHDMGLIGGVLQPMYSGFPVHLMSPATFLQRPVRWLEAISRYRGTISVAPNFAYEQCVRRIRPEQLAKLDLSSWQVAGNGAEPVRADTLRAFSRTFAPAGFNTRAFFPCYGMAEATLYATGGPVFRGARVLQASRQALNHGQIVAPTGSDAIDLVSCGAVAPEVQVRIVDPASGRECRSGEVGEIWLAGDSIAAGYWEQPEATIETFLARLPGSARHWLRSGDLGSLVDGELYVTGRLKDLIIVRGQNHYPHDIEATIDGIHPALRAHGGAAFGVEHEGCEQLAVVLELERNVPAGDVAGIAALVRDVVSRQHQLHIDRLAFVRPGGIPRTSSGKVQRYLTRQRLLQGALPFIEEKQEAVACP
jgi:acyl-CoA synthetase (AMP-forming)/AMP-acid ligase II